MTDYTYDSWKKDLLTTHILIYFCPQCGTKLRVDDNLYFPDTDTYICDACNIAFTPIHPGEIIVTYQNL